jgi:hypothetical protein
MEASQHSLLAACFTLHSINATLAIVPQRGAGLWIGIKVISGLLPKNSRGYSVGITDDRGLLMVSGGMIYTSSFIKIGSGLQKMLGRVHVQTQTA